MLHFHYRLSFCRVRFLWFLSRFCRFCCHYVSLFFLRCCVYIYICAAHFVYPSWASSLSLTIMFSNSLLFEFAKMGFLSVLCDSLLLMSMMSIGSVSCLPFVSVSSQSLSSALLLPSTYSDYSSETMKSSSPWQFYSHFLTFFGTIIYVSLKHRADIFLYFAPQPINMVHATCFVDHVVQVVVSSSPFIVF